MGARRRVVGAAVILFLCVSCPLLNPFQPTERLDLSEVRYWAYQIQGLTEPGATASLEASRYDLLVLEPTRTDVSSEETRRFNTAETVARLKVTASHDGKHPKLVLAYIDIGEAEDWRWYWTWSASWPEGDPRPSDWPPFIVTRDPEGWEGDYPVAYWDPAWKDLMIYGVPDSGQPYDSVLDEVIDDGFDGVYLDWVEGFEDSAVYEAAQAAGKDPAAEMVTFIQEIRDYAAQRGQSDFLIVQQNAVNLIDGHPELTGLIDGIAQEAVWFDGEASGNWNDPDGHDLHTEPILTDYYLEYLARYQEAGLPVFDCEYAVHHAAEAYAKSDGLGFVPYASRTSLAQLTTTPPPGY